MATSFPNPNSDSGLKKLDEHLLTRDYITGNQASKDDITVFTALAEPPSSQYVNASRWYIHIDTLLKNSGVFAEGSGVIVEGSAPVAEEDVATHLETQKSMDELSQILLKGDLMSLIKLIKKFFEQPAPSQLFDKCTSHIEGKSNEELKEAILNLDLKELIQIVKVCERSGRSMDEFLKVVVDHLVGKSREDFSKMVSTKYDPLELELLLDEAEKTLRVYQVKFFRKTNEATNGKVLEKWKKLFKAVVLPKLEDEGLIRFRNACRGASMLVDSEISSRYISLRRNEIPLQVNDVEIKLENRNGFSVEVSLRGSLQSGILCAERVKNIKIYGKERSVTHYTNVNDDVLLRIASGYCKAASSEDANDLAIWEVELENAGNRTLLDIMWVCVKSFFIHCSFLTSICDEGYLCDGPWERDLTIDYYVAHLELNETESDETETSEDEDDSD